MCSSCHGGQQADQLLVVQTGRHELLACHLAVGVKVHALEDGGGAVLEGGREVWVEKRSGIKSSGLSLSRSRSLMRNMT